MNAILLAILSMLATGISDFLYKRARIRNASPELFLAFQSIFFNAANLTFAGYLGHIEISPLTILIGAICASLVYLSVFLFLKGLKEGQASTNVPVFRLSFIVTSILAFILYQETLTFGKIIAIGLAVFSILALSRSLQMGTPSLSVMFQLVLATIVYGLFGFVYKIAISIGLAPIGVLIFQGASFIIYAFFIALRRGRISWSRDVMMHAPICGVLLSSSFLFLLESLKYGEVSVSFSIVQLSFMVTSVLAILAWHEKIRFLNILGIFAAMLAVVFFAYI